MMVRLASLFSHLVAFLNRNKFMNLVMANKSTLIYANKTTPGNYFETCFMKLLIFVATIRRMVKNSDSKTN